MKHRRSSTSSISLFDIREVDGHSLEAKDRSEVNDLLAHGWKILHIYTLKYPEDGVWRERPMAILGRPFRQRGRMRTSPANGRGRSSSDYS